MPAAASATRGHGGEIIKRAEAGVIPISIPKSPTLAINKNSIGCPPDRRLKRPTSKMPVMHLGRSLGFCRCSKQRRSENEQSRKNRQFAANAHRILPFVLGQLSTLLSLYSALDMAAILVRPTPRDLSG